MSALCQIFSSLLAFVVLVFNGSHAMFVDMFNNHEFTVDASAVVSKDIENPVSNINVWSISENGPFVNVENNKENDIFEFVDYIQLMQCTGGTYERDLFVDPYNTDVLDDYDFSALIDNCRGILSLGAKPLLKLGSVPMKYTSAAASGEFETNIYPPDDYNVYYNYIKAITEALVDEFGLQEVLSWRFGVMTEYENASWFMAKSGDPEDSAIEFCKLYDYTVQALIDVLGNDVFVGAHSMSVTEGLWDEAIFIKHCANGTNYANGKKGSVIKYLSASFYDITPGKFTNGKTLVKTIDFLRNTAEKAGLTDLIYGIDEGRILSGNTAGKDSDQLLTRTCGYTYQAAYDARLYKQMIKNDINYFSAWSYLSNGLLEGNPTVSYHVAKLIASFEGSDRIRTTNKSFGTLIGQEVDVLSAFDNASETLRLMTYNFRNNLNYKAKAELELTINVPQFDGKQVNITTYVIDDDCNYFDEWNEDRVKYNITDDCFSWSPDDPQIDNPITLSDPAAREIYKTELYDKYTECSKLVPTQETATIENGTLTINTVIDPNTVVFYEITPAE